VSLPDLACDSLIASGLLPDAVYELSFTGPNVSSSPAAVLPGVLAEMLRLRTNSQGVLRLEHSRLGNLGLRIAPVLTSLHTQTQTVQGVWNARQ
jgi:hypothetical protein